MNVTTTKFHSTQDSLTREFASSHSGWERAKVSKKMSNISGASSAK